MWQIEQNSWSMRLESQRMDHLVESNSHFMQESKLIPDREPLSLYLNTSGKGTYLENRCHDWLARHPYSQTDNSKMMGEGRHWNVREVWEGPLECKCAAWKREADPNPRVIAWEHPKQTGYFQNKASTTNWLPKGQGEGKKFLCCLHVKMSHLAFLILYP